jgi:hypothetical protein
VLNLLLFTLLKEIMKILKVYFEFIMFKQEFGQRIMSIEKRMHPYEEEFKSTIYLATNGI